MFDRLSLARSGFAGAGAGRATWLARNQPRDWKLDRKLDHHLRAASTIRNGVFFLLLLLIAALLLSRYSRRDARRRHDDDETSQAADDGPALPGPHIDANTRMQLDNRPQTFYDWVRASNAASRASDMSG